MTRTDLPLEVRQKPLDYKRLVSTLDMIHGEPVIVRLASREADNVNTAGVASIVGELKHQIPAPYEGDEFSIGSPYPDRYPEHLAGGILFIREETFESATLTTFDGNDYFIVASRRAVWRSSSRTPVRPTHRPRRPPDVKSNHSNLARRRESPAGLSPIRPRAVGFRFGRPPTKAAASAPV